MLLVWYNPNSDSFYIKYTRLNYTDKKVGYKNQYNHQVVSIFYVDCERNKLILCDSFLDFCNTNRKKEETKTNKLINGIIRLLYRLKK